MSRYNPAEKYVLVVEDSSDLRMLLRSFFEIEDCQVEFAANGKEALEFLATAKRLPSFILLDLMMPVMDGFVFRQEQRSDPRLASIPIVVMTAHGQIDLHKITLGATDYIKKPFDIADLQRVTLRYCS